MNRQSFYQTLAMNKDGVPEIVITDEEFRKFREFFYRKTGIHFDDNKRYFVDKRLVERIHSCDEDSFRSWFVRLRFENGDEELQQLVNLMTVNETYFFRESYQFDCMVYSMLPEIAASKQPGDTIRIWSVPSSTGEEPYSIALYLLEYWPGLANYDVEIIASDIDTRVLMDARRGWFSNRSVSHLPDDIMHKYFIRQGDDRWRISDELRESVTFTHVNLNAVPRNNAYRGFDLVFCRNLLIYFDDLSRRAAAEAFYEALNPGGFICLGHSESMSRISSLFRVRKLRDAIVYQKSRI